MIRIHCTREELLEYWNERLLTYQRCLSDSPKESRKALYRARIDVLYRCIVDLEAWMPIKSKKKGARRDIHL